MEVLGFLVELSYIIPAWRIYLCTVLLIGIAVLLHLIYPEADWPIILSVVVIPFSIIGGSIWHINKRNLEK